MSNERDIERSKRLLQVEKELSTVEEERLNTNTEISRTLQRIEDSYQKQLNAINEILQSNNTIFTQKESEVKRLEIEVRHNRELLSYYEKLLYNKKLEGEAGEKNKKFLDEALSKIKEISGISENDIRSSQEILDSFEKRTLELEKQVELSRGIVNSQQNLDAQVKNLISSYAKVSDNWRGTAIGQFFSLANTGGISTALSTIGASLAKNFSITDTLASKLVGVIQMTNDLVKVQDQAVSSLNRTTVGAGKYNELLIKTERSNYTFNITAKEAEEAIAELSVKFRGFNDLAQISQLRLTTLTTQLNKLGIASSITASIFQTLQKSFNLTYEESERTTREILATAKALNLGGAQLLSMFDSIAPKLASFGKEAPRIFKELTVIVSNTGAEMNRLLSIAEKFDTFESAANSVGKLNAILGGGFLDTLQMIQTTNPSERILLLKNAIDQAGKSFDTMSYYERKAIADAAGFADVNEMAQILNSSIGKNIAAAKEKALTDQQMADVMQKVQSIGEKISALWRSMAMNLSFVLGPIRSVLDVFLNLTKSLGSFSFLLIPAATAAISVIIKLTSSFAGLGPKLISTAKGLFSTASSAKIAGENIGKVANPITSISSAAKEGATKMLAFAAAAVAVGIGFYLAGQGIAAVGNSMKELDTWGKVALVAITAIIGAIIALAVVAAPASIPLLALGAAIGLIGAGVWMLGKGISLIITPLSEMGKNMANLVTALNTASAIKILGIAGAIKAVAQAIGAVPEGKTVMFTSMLQQANAIEAGVPENVERLVNQAVKYKVSQENSKTQVDTQFTKLIETTSKIGGGEKSEGQTIVLKLDGEVLGKIVGKIVGKQFHNVALK